MKIKNILSITAFAAFFSIGLMLSVLSTNLTFPRTFKKESNAQTQTKIYDFLQQDRQNIKAMVNKLENRTSGDHIAFVSALKDYSESAEKIDTSDLPEDFQFAWKKYSTVKREWADFISHLKSMPNQAILNNAEKVIADQKIAEEIRTWNAVVSVVNHYGVDVDSNNNISFLQK